MATEDELSDLKKRLTTLETLIRQSPGLRSVHLGNNTLFIRLDGGRRLYIDSRDTVIAPQLMTLGHWERYNTSLIRRLVKPGMRFVDIGANCGYFSVLGGSLVGEKGRVFSFEPQPRAFELLGSSMRANGFVLRSRLHNVALADHDGSARFRFRDGDFGGGSLHIQDARVQTENFTEIEVPVRRGDSLLQKHGAIDFIKIDAEGAEVAIIDGLTQTLAQSPNVRMLLEFNPSYIAKHRGVVDFCDQLSAMGFSAYPVTDNAPKLVPWAEIPNTVGHGYVLFSRGSI
jgi:FkbM family methyltransferase